MRIKLRFLFIVFICFMFLSIGDLTLEAQEVRACLISKDDTNPFSLAIIREAVRKAGELDVNLNVHSGTKEGDTETQTQAIKSCILDRVHGIIIAASDSKEVVPELYKAREAGIRVIAIDTPLEPESTADITFATDQFAAGELAGVWAADMVGAADDVRIAFITLLPSHPSVDVLRNQGFMYGFGIDTMDVDKIGDEKDERVVGQEVSYATMDGGRMAMQKLLQKDPNINIVFSSNELAAAGAYQAIKAAKKERKILLIAIDGSCTGIRKTKKGILAAVVQQYPHKMVAGAIEALDSWVRRNEPPITNRYGVTMVNTGVKLVTNKPVDNVSSINTSTGFKHCW